MRHALWTLVLMGVISALAAGCGGGGGGQADAAAVPDQTTQLSFEPTLSEFARQSIVEVLTPSSSAQPNASVLAPTATMSGQSLVLAVDSAGEVVAAAMVKSSATSIGAESTAIALARLILKPARSPKEATQLDAAIRESQAYSALVESLNTSLSTGTPPLRSSEVVADLLALTDDVSQAISQRTANSSQLRAKETVIGPFPFTLMKDFARKPKSVQLIGDPLCAPITNPMPIPWNVSVTRNGALLRSAIIPAESTQCIQGEAGGYDLVISQDERTQSATQIKVFAEILAQALSVYLDGDFCFQKLPTAITEATLDVMGDGTYDGFANAIQSPATIAKALDLAGCASVSLAMITAKIASITKRLGDLADLDSAADTVPPAAYLKRFFNESRSFGVCVSAQNKTVNCAKEYRFTPSTVLMVPGASLTPLLEAYDVRGALTGLPSGLDYSPQDANVAGVDPATGRVSANMASPNPVQIRVQDKWAGAEGALTVQVVDGVLWPTGPAIKKNGTVVVTFQSASGAPLEVAGATLTFVNLSENILETTRLLTCSMCWAVKGIGTGKGTVGVYNSKTGHIATSAVTVEDTPARLRAFPLLSALEIGKTIRFRAMAYDGGGASVPVPTDLKWSSTNRAVFEVNETTGLVTATGVGRAEIIVSSVSARLSDDKSVVVVTDTTSSYPTPQEVPPPGGQDLIYVRSASAFQGGSASSAPRWAAAPPSLDGLQLQDLLIPDPNVPGGGFYSGSREYWYCRPANDACFSWASGATVGP